MSNSFSLFAYMIWVCWLIGSFISRPFQIIRWLAWRFTSPWSLRKRVFVTFNMDQSFWITIKGLDYKISVVVFVWHLSGLNFLFYGGKLLCTGEENEFCLNLRESRQSATDVQSLWTETPWGAVQCRTNYARMIVPSKYFYSFLDSFVLSLIDRANYFLLNIV